MVVRGNVSESADSFGIFDLRAGSAISAISLDGGSNLNVNGTFTNRADSPFGVPTSAALNLTNNSTATIAGLFSNNNGTISLQNGSHLALGQSLSNFSVDSGAGDSTAAAMFQLDTLSTATIAGDLSNTASSSIFEDGSSLSTVALSGSSLAVNNLINIATPLPGGEASVEVNLTGGSSLVVSGSVTNKADDSGGS